MSARFSLLRSTGIIGAATFLSRVLGLVRDGMISAVLDGATADAFLAAFRIPSLLRELFAEGALSSAFVPTLSATRKQHGDAEANRLAGVVLRLLALVVFGVTLLGMALAPWIAGFFLVGRHGGEAAHTVAVASGLLCAMFPYLFFISLAAVTMGLLNSLLRFAVPALSPALLNLCMIGALGLGYWQSGGHDPVRLAWWLAGGVVFGGAVQFLSQFAQARQMGYFRPLRGPLWHPGASHMLALMGPRAMGAAITQLSVVVSTILASFLSTGSILVLWNAVRLFQFPLGVLGVAITTAAFPKLSIDATADDREVYRRTLLSGLRAVWVIMAPATVGLILISGYAVEAIYNHGRFAQDGRLGPTSLALICYTLGLVGHTGSKYLASAFYALHDTRTPLYVSIAALGVHTLASWLLMVPLDVAGLALGTSITGLFQMLVLGWGLRRKAGVSYLPIMGHALRVLAATAVMGGAAWGVLQLLPPPGSGFRLALLGTGIGVITGMLAYAAMVRMLLPEEWQRIRRTRRQPA